MGHRREPPPELRHPALRRRPGTGRRPQQEGLQQGPSRLDPPLDRFEGDTDRLWGTYSQYLGSIGFADDVEFSFTGFGHHDYRNYYVGLDSARTFNPANPPAFEQDAPRDYKVWGLEPRVSFTIYGDKVNQTWMIGGRYVREDTEFEVYRKSLSTGAVTTVRDWDFDTEGKATYISNAISMLDGRLTITPGIRHERVHQDYSDAVTGKKTENLDDEWLPGLTVGFQMTDDWYLFANAQRSLRVPQITTIVYDGDVSSEVAWNYEAGFRYTPLPNLRYDFNLYRIDFDDQIVFQDGAWKNVGSTRQQGFETELFWTPAAMPNLDLHASYAFLDAKIRTGQYEGNEVPYASQSQFNVDGRWRFAEGWTYTLDGLYVSEAYSDDANHREENATGSYGELPSYWIWNTSLERKFKLKRKRADHLGRRQQPVRPRILLPRHRHQSHGPPAGARTRRHGRGQLPLLSLTPTPTALQASPSSLTAGRPLPGERSCKGLSSFSVTSPPMPSAKASCLPRSGAGTRFCSSPTTPRATGATWPTPGFRSTGWRSSNATSSTRWR
ncbi:TonB-dependent receptor family protein [Azotobacter sp. CWF10]